MTDDDAGAVQTEHPLTRRQREVLRHITSGGKVHADYQGGPADDMDNWEFTVWSEYAAAGCAKSARVLIAAGLARIAERDSLGSHFLVPVCEAVTS